MRKLILKNAQSPGDIVMLIAAVRDQHRAHPGEFLVDVRTSCPDLWLNHPNLTSLADGDRTSTLSSISTVASSTARRSWCRRSAILPRG